MLVSLVKVMRIALLAINILEQVSYWTLGSHLLVCGFQDGWRSSATEAS